jgi:hypothetical protein
MEHTGRESNNGEWDMKHGLSNETGRKVMGYRIDFEGIAIKSMIKAFRVLRNYLLLFLLDLLSLALH